MFDGVLRLLAILFLTSLMFSIGLAVTWRELWEPFRHLGFLAKVLVANIVFMPLAGFALARLFSLKPDVELGFLFMAAAPGAPFALQFTSKTRSQQALAAGLFFVLSAVAVLLSPFIANLLFIEHVAISIPYGAFTLQRVLWIFVPLLLGLLVHRRWTSAAQKLSSLFTVVSIVAFVGCVIATSGARSQVIKEIGGHSLLAMAALIVFGLVVGWLLGGPKREVRRVLATGTSMRNVALGLLVAAPVEHRPDIAAAMIAFAALMIPLNALFTFGDLGLAKLQARRRARQNAS